MSIRALPVSLISHVVDIFRDVVPKDMYMLCSLLNVYAVQEVKTYYVFVVGTEKDNSATSTVEEDRG